jgi:hypothetical protein
MAMAVSLRMFLWQFSDVTLKEGNNFVDYYFFKRNSDTAYNKVNLTNGERRI